MDPQIFKQSFFHARLKINRANRHISEAQQLFKSLAESDFCTIIDDTDTDTGAQILRAQARQIPADLVLAIGDAFHCLSSALEYVASGMMRAKTGDTTRISFPTNESRKALRDSFKRPKPGKTTPPTRRIVEAFPLVALELLTAIKPYQGGDYGLWEVRKADNIDKHNLIIPSVTVATVTLFNLVDEMHNSRIGQMTMAVGAGGVINGLLYDVGGSRMKFDDNVEFSLSITFPKDAEVFAGNPVFPTLLQASQLVSGAIERIEVIARKYI